MTANTEELHRFLYQNPCFLAPLGIVFADWFALALRGYVRKQQPALTAIRAALE